MVTAGDHYSHGPVSDSGLSGTDAMSESCVYDGRGMIFREFRAAHAAICSIASRTGFIRPSIICEGLFIFLHSIHAFEHVLGAVPRERYALLISCINRLLLVASLSWFGIPFRLKKKASPKEDCTDHKRHRSHYCRS